MKLLVVNPNTNEAMTDVLVGRARAVLPEAEVVGVTAPFGSIVLARRRDVALAGGAVLAALAGHGDGIDAAIIGAFADPGLEAAKEAMSFPVTGLLESSVLTAMQLGSRIGLLYAGTRMIPALEERLRGLGIRDRVCAIRTPSEGLRPTDWNGILEVYGAVARDMIADERIEVLVLGGGVLTGMARDFECLTGVAVVDCVDCAVLQASLLARLAPAKALQGSFSLPVATKVANVSPSLEKLFTRGSSS